MILRYYGHAFVELELSDGKKIVFDPYGDFYNYPKRKVSCDVCLISHHHDDHDGISCLAGKPEIIDKPGVYHLMDKVWIHGIQTDHDEQGGALRGKNTVFKVEAEDLVIVHAGDLGHTLTAEQLHEIGSPDILFLPVGGYYTIDAATAETVRKQLRPSIMIPIHYQTDFNPEMPIHPLAEYLQLIGFQGKPLSLMRVTRADLDERNEVELLEIQP